MAVSEAEAGDVKLLGRWESPYVIRVGIALKLKGIGYEFIEETMVPKSELLLKSNPVYKKIPVLFHGEKTVSESLVIVQYIDEVWGGVEGTSILPSDPYERATARFWAVYIDDKLFPSMFGIIKEKTKEQKAEAATNAMYGMQLLEEAFQKCSKGKRFFGGATINYLDIVLGGFLGWIEAMKELAGVELMNELRTPHLLSWAKEFRSDEVVKEVLLGTDRFVEFGRMLQARWNAEPAK